MCVCVYIYILKDSGDGRIDVIRRFLKNNFKNDYFYEKVTDCGKWLAFWSDTVRRISVHLF